MSIDFANSPLTPPIHYVTSVKAPLVEVDVVDGKSVIVHRESATATINVDVCSELAEVTSASSVAKANHKLAIVSDTSGQPIIFSVGTNNRLYCTWHVEGAGNWQFRDITPGSKDHDNTKAKAFDVLQLPGPNRLIHIGAAVVPDGNLKDGDCDVYRCANVDIGGILADQHGEIPWIRAPNNLQPFHVRTLRLAPSKNPAPGQPPSPSYMIAGTLERGQTMASNYLVSLDADNQQPWSRHSIPTDSHVMIDVTPGLLPGKRGPGIFSLYRIQPQGAPSAETVYTGTQVRFKGFNELINIAPTLDKLGGSARSISTSINASGYTDLFVAGSTGVGYWPCTLLDGESKDQLLRGYDINQVVAHESNRKITVIATSTAGELFVVEGTRPPGAPLAMPIWSSSGIPIRADVTMMTAQRNPQLDFSQLVYVSSDRRIKHLVKDPQTTLWQEQTIHVASPTEITNVPAYITQMTLRDTDGNAVHEGYQVELTASQICYVSVNDKTHELSNKPTKVTTDNNGQIRVVLETQGSLSAPTYSLHLRSASANAALNVDPTQRVLRHLLAIKTGAQIRDAKDALGNAVFSAGKVSQEASEGMAKVFGALPSLVAAADKDALDRLGPGTDAKARVVENPAGSFACGEGKVAMLAATAGDGGLIERIVDTAGKVYHRVKGFINDAIDKVFDWVGDLLEGLVRGIIRGFKAAWKMENGKLKMFIEAAGKVIQVVCDKVAPVLDVYLTMLKEGTGIDLKAAWDWLASKIAPTRIQETHKVVSGFAENTIRLFGGALAANKPYIVYLIERLRSLIDVPDKRVPKEAQKAEGSKTSVWSVLKGIFGEIIDVIFNNPIVHGILKLLTRIMKAITEELYDVIHMPSMQPIIDVFVSILPQLGKEQGELLKALIDDILDKGADMVDGKISFSDGLSAILGDTFWTLFDSLKAVILSCVDIIDKFIQAFMNFLSGDWEVPILSALWRFTTGSNLTILNVLTYPIAFALNLAASVKHNKRPFEVWADPSTWLPTKESLIAEVPELPQAPEWKGETFSNMAANTSFAGQPDAAQLAAMQMQMQTNPFVSFHSQDPFTSTEKSSSSGSWSQSKSHDQHAHQKLRTFRMTDSACATAATCLQLLGASLELVAIRSAHARLKDVPPERIKEAKGLYEQFRADGVHPQLLRDAVNARKKELGVAPTHLEHSLEGIKCAIRFLVVVCHTVSTVVTFIDAPLHCKHEMAGWKLSGTIINFGSTIMGMCAIGDSDKLAHASDTLMVIGNGVGFFGAGLTEFVHAEHKSSWDNLRLAADCTELAAGICGGIAVWVNKPEAAWENPGLYLVIADGVFTIAGLTQTAILLDAYRSNNFDAIKE